MNMVLRKCSTLAPLLLRSSLFILVFLQSEAFDGFQMLDTLQQLPLECQAGTFTVLCSDSHETRQCDRCTSFCHSGTNDCESCEIHCTGERLIRDKTMCLENCEVFLLCQVLRYQAQLMAGSGELTHNRSDVQEENEIATEEGACHLGMRVYLICVVSAIGFVILFCVFLLIYIKCKSVSTSPRCFLCKITTNLKFLCSGRQEESHYATVTLDLNDPVPMSPQGSAGRNGERSGPITHTQPTTSIENISTTM